MPNIKLLQPAKLDEAVALLAAEHEEAKVIAGGTALVIMLRNRLIAPKRIGKVKVVSVHTMPDNQHHPLN